MGMMSNGKEYRTVGPDYLSPLTLEELNERLRAIDEQYRRIMEVVCMTKNNQTK